MKIVDVQEYMEAFHVYLTSEDATIDDLDKLQELHRSHSMEFFSFVVDVAGCRIRIHMFLEYGDLVESFSGCLKTCIVRALKFNPQCPICKRDANKRHLRPDLQVASLLKNSEILLNQLHHIGKDL